MILHKLSFFIKNVCNIDTSIIWFICWFVPNNTIVITLIYTNKVKICYLWHFLTVYIICNVSFFWEHHHIKMSKFVCFYVYLTEDNRWKRNLLKLDFIYTYYASFEACLILVIKKVDFLIKINVCYIDIFNEISIFNE